MDIQISLTDQINDEQVLAIYKANKWLAHKFYFKQGLTIASFHFSEQLNPK